MLLEKGIMTLTENILVNVTWLVEMWSETNGGGRQIPIGFRRKEVQYPKRPSGLYFSGSLWKRSMTSIFSG